MFKGGLILKRNILVTGIIFLFIISAVSPISIGYNVKTIHQRPISNNLGNTLYVGGSGPDNYTKIQDAIDNASDGDTVFVFNGTYFGYIIINKSINLIGADKNTTFIRGFVAFTISIISDWVNISGFTIQNGERSGEGVRIDSCYNNFINNIIDTPNDNIRVSGECNTISSNIITGDSIILSGDSNTISGNIIINKYHGIYLTDSCDNIISNNSFLNSGLFISEDNVWNNIVTNNTMNGKPLVYVYDESDLVIDVDAGQIILVNCTNITVENQEIFNTTVGILIWGSDSCVISGNIITGNHYGICIYGWNNTINDNTITNNTYEGIRLFGDSNTFSDNTISNNDDGIYLYYSDHNNIINNTITTNNYYSILLDYGSDFNNIINNTITNSYGAIRLSGYNNTLSGNTISNNDDGIYLYYCDHNNIINNTITNSNCGIHILGASNDNMINHNNLINNTLNAYDEGNTIWDDGKYGNYWSDYEERYPNAKPRLLKPWMWNTPYGIEGGSNIDNCPLVKQWPESLSRTMLRNNAMTNSLWLRLLEHFPLLNLLL